MDFVNYLKVHTNKGRQYWEFTQNWEELSVQEQQNFIAQFNDFDRDSNPNTSDLVFKELVSSAAQHNTDNALQKGLSYYNSLQQADGNWGGDYGGPLFLLPGLVVASTVTDSPFEPWQQALMRSYIKNQQQADGGWGLHIEGRSTLFGTVMNYVALRLLGVENSETKMKAAQEWIGSHGGATHLPSWGKFYLSVLGVYEWEGNTSLFPEMWLLPKSLPLHPSNFWCHTRMVYLPMSYCYGEKMVGPITDTILALRKELYTEDYDKIAWSKVRTKIAQTDSYFPATGVAKFFNGVANAYERIHPSFFRKKANAFCLDYINAEDEQTNYIDIGPVNQVINSLAIYHAYGKDSEQFQQHRLRWKDYLWVAEDGMKMQGYNGSQLWDTAFYVHALTENEDEQHHLEITNKAYDFIDYTQIKEEVVDREKWYRHQSKGGWPFSTLEHGWPISDCTALGLSAAIRLTQSKHINKNSISVERMREAVDVILSYQNKDGSWSTYEKQRTSTLLEQLNPAEIFGEIMVDYPHIECSSSCVQALVDFQNIDADYRKNEIAISLDKGVNYILDEQEEQGGWYGNWGICYCYGTWFALEALNNVFTPNERIKRSIDKACQFLIKHQHVQNGWGESYESCTQKQYIQHKMPQVVQTAWATLALMGSGYEKHESVAKGIQYLKDTQLSNGDFPQQSISGVFNHNCMITYTAYRNVFPLWALARSKRLKV